MHQRLTILHSKKCQGAAKSLYNELDRVVTGQWLQKHKKHNIPIYLCTRNTTPRLAFLPSMGSPELAHQRYHPGGRFQTLLLGAPWYVHTSHPHSKFATPLPSPSSYLSFHHLITTWQAIDFAFAFVQRRFLLSFQFNEHSWMYISKLHIVCTCTS